MADSRKDRMGTTELLLRVMMFALAGWLASSYRVMRSRLRPGWRRGLIIPLWFGWMVFGLGGPVYAGSLTLTDAMATGASFTVGMTVYLLLYSLQRHRRRH